MRRIFSIGFVGAMLFVALGAPAQAGTIVTATWTGTMRASSDAGGHFGAPGTIAAGTAFTLVSVFDTALGTFDSGAQSITGGGKATLSINSHDFTFALEPSSYALAAANRIGLGVGDPSTTPTFLTATFFSLGVPASILTPFEADCFADTFCSGTFEIDGLSFSGGGFDAAHLSVAIATTPIPASLPLLASALLGLALVGRRRVL
jgi:hypothetical protein